MSPVTYPYSGRHATDGALVEIRSSGRDPLTRLKITHLGMTVTLTTRTLPDILVRFFGTWERLAFLAAHATRTGHFPGLTNGDSLDLRMSDWVHLHDRNAI